MVLIVGRNSFTDIPLDPSLHLYSVDAVKDHKIILRYIIQISSHYLFIVKSERKFVVALLEAVPVSETAIHNNSAFSSAATDVQKNQKVLLSSRSTGINS